MTTCTFCERSSPDRVKHANGCPEELRPDLRQSGIRRWRAGLRDSVQSGRSREADSTYMLGFRYGQRRANPHVPEGAAIVPMHPRVPQCRVAA
jgi:hypothetical protein